MKTFISSLQNTRIKQVVKLRNRRYRDSANLTIVEGIREIKQALDNNIQPSAAFICPEIISDKQADDIASQLDTLANNNSVSIYEIPAEVYAKIAYRGESGGILLLLPYWHCQLKNLPIKKNAFIVIVENAEKPGNVGAILRTAEAAGVDGVIICSSGKVASTDIFNPNVIRASLGAIFSLPITMTTTNAAIAWLQKHNLQIVAATPEATKVYTAVNLTQPTAIVTGSEAHGLSNDWLINADQKVAIPMVGSIDSLNLSVSTALMLYETVRQRKG